MLGLLQVFSPVLVTEAGDILDDGVLAGIEFIMEGVFYGLDGHRLVMVTTFLC